MKSFQEFTREAFLETSKQSAALIVELCGSDNSLSTAIKALLYKYQHYLESIRNSIQDSLLTYDQELKVLQERIDSFKDLPPQKQVPVIIDELKVAKDIIEKCKSNATETIQIATHIREEAKASTRTGLEKEAENLIVQAADIEINTNSNLIKLYGYQGEGILSETADEKALQIIVNKKLGFLQAEYNQLLNQKQNAERNLSAILETIKKLNQ